jgi:hypothetical protein
LLSATATSALHAAAVASSARELCAKFLRLLPSLVAGALLAAADRRCALSDHSAVGQ